MRGFFRVRRENGAHTTQNAKLVTLGSKQADNAMAYRGTLSRHGIVDEGLGRFGSRGTTGHVAELAIPLLSIRVNRRSRRLSRIDCGSQCVFEEMGAP